MVFCFAGGGMCCVSVLQKGLQDVMNGKAGITAS